MFEKIGPQLARHESGYTVFVADREHVGYRDALIEAAIDADFLSGIVPLYFNTLCGNEGREFTYYFFPLRECRWLCKRCKTRKHIQHSRVPGSSQ
jgi:hypothetical protein